MKPLLRYITARYPGIWFMDRDQISVIAPTADPFVLVALCYRNRYGSAWLEATYVWSVAPPTNVGGLDWKKLDDFPLGKKKKKEDFEAIAMGIAEQLESARRRVQEADEFYPYGFYPSWDRQVFRLAHVIWLQDSEGLGLSKRTPICHLGCNWSAFSPGGSGWHLTVAQFWPMSRSLAAQ